MSKHQKKEDRICNLPTNLITHILSLLPTKDVVRTSTLSTYWKEQWMPITRLDFDDIDFFSPMFVKFVHRTLRFLRVTRLDLFQLTGHKYYGKQVNAWLSAALSRDVQQLDLNILLVDQHVLPLSLFTSKTLVVLKLSRDFVLQVPTTISLHSLKILRLDSVGFLDDDSLSRFISGCPALEDLDMRGSKCANVQVISISSLGLKRLTLLHFAWDCDENYTYEIVLNTPNLQYLKYSGHLMSKRYSIESLRCLIKADINLGIFPHLDLNHGSNAMQNLFVALSNVRILCLCSLYIRDNNEIYYRMPIFRRLTYLKIYVGTLLTNILGSAPHLQTLAIEDDFVNWCPPTSVPFCMLYHLKVVEIVYFRGEIVRYFLENSEVLEELRIRYSSSSMRKKLLDLPRASRSCRIVLT